MQQKYGRNRPGLDYLQMDALQTEFPTASFSTIFDKGTLDALFTDGTDESKERIGRLFNVRSLFQPLCIENISAVTQHRDETTRNGFVMS